MQGECKKASLLVLLPSRSHFYAKSVGLSWHTSSVGVPGYSKYCPTGSGALCEAACLMRHVAGARHKPNKPLALDADVS